MWICYSVNPRRQSSDRVVRKFREFSLSRLVVCVSALTRVQTDYVIEVHRVLKADDVVTFDTALSQIQQSKQVRALSQAFKGNQGFRAGVLSRRRS